MKLKLSVNDIPYNGYTNIDPYPNLDDPASKNCKVLIGNPGDLSNIEQSTCTDIYVRNYVEHLNTDNIYDVIKSWTSKLRHHGKITITGTDLDSVVRAFINGQMDAKEFNAIIYGEQKHAWDSKSICMNFMHITEILLDCGMKIISKELNGTKYIVTAERP